MNSITAVVRGAAIVGIENLSDCKMLACPRSYGIAIDESYSSILHHIKDRFEDPVSNTVIAKDQLKWLIRKGDVILSNEHKKRQKLITIEFEEFSPKTGKIPIYAFDFDNLPSRLCDSLGGRLNTYFSNAQDLLLIECFVSRSNANSYN